MNDRWHLCKRSLFAALAVVIICTGALPFALGEDGAEDEIDASWEFSRANRLAGAGAITRSIPHYEKVLKAAPDQYPQAYYNLAEVYRFKEMCAKAVLLYHAYAAVERQEANRADAARGISECTKDGETGTLTAKSSPQEGAQIHINGYLIGRSGAVDGIELLEGEYVVDVSLEDHVSQKRSVQIEAGAKEEIEVELEKKLFFGTVRIEVDQEEAQIKLEPLELDSPKAKEKTITASSPMKDSQKLPTGKYFLEVTKPNYDRWIRNIRVERDEETVVNVSMNKGLPEAIRRQ